ncbi:hypothetical protein ACVWZK_007767 [Bradyrhizobium sp. GM0.4]
MLQTRFAIAAAALLTLPLPASAQFAPPPAKPAAPRATWALAARGVVP